MALAESGRAWKARRFLLGIVRGSGNQAARIWLREAYFNSLVLGREFLTFVLYCSGPWLLGGWDRGDVWIPSERSVAWARPGPLKSPSKSPASLTLDHLTTRRPKNQAETSINRTDINSMDMEFGKEQKRLGFNDLLLRSCRPRHRQ